MTKEIKERYLVITFGVTLLPWPYRPINQGAKNFALAKVITWQNPIQPKPPPKRYQQEKKEYGLLMISLPHPCLLPHLHLTVPCLTMTINLALLLHHHLAIKTSIRSKNSWRILMACFCLRNLPSMTLVLTRYRQWKLPGKHHPQIFVIFLLSVPSDSRHLLLTLQVHPWNLCKIVWEENPLHCWWEGFHHAITKSSN